MMQIEDEAVESQKEPACTVAVRHMKRVSTTYDVLKR